MRARARVTSRARVTGRILAGVVLVATLMSGLVAAGGIEAHAAPGGGAAAIQARIDALQSQLTAAGRRVHDLTSAYADAEVRLAELSTEVAADQARARQAGAQVQSVARALQGELVMAYVGAYTGTADAAVAAGSPLSDPAVRQGYIDLANGSVQDNLDAYRTARVTLASALGAEAAQEQAARSAAAEALQARGAAVAQAGAISAQVDAMGAQLAALQRQEAAAAAQPAGGPASSSSPVRATGAASAGADRKGSTQGGPAPGGLLAVVRAQVDAPPQTTGPEAAPLPAPPTRAPGPPVTAPPVTAPPVTAPPVTAPPPTAPPVTAPPAPAPAPGGSGTTTGSDGGAGGVWLQLRQCESGDDYQADTGNGFFGAYQFTQQTWSGLGYPGRPDQEPPSMQDSAAMKLQAEAGWGQWPACSAALGLS